MTQIINGYAQADIYATKGSDKRLIFVETNKSLEENAEALWESLLWIRDNWPDVKVDLHVLKVRRK